MKSESFSPPRRRRRSGSCSQRNEGRKREFRFVSVYNLPRDLKFTEAERLLDEFGRLAALPFVEHFRSAAEATAEFCDPRDARTAATTLDGTLFCGRRIRATLVPGPSNSSRCPPPLPKRRGRYPYDSHMRYRRRSSRSLSGSRGREHCADFSNRCRGARADSRDSCGSGEFYARRRDRGHGSRSREHNLARDYSRDGSSPRYRRSRSPTDRGGRMLPRDSSEKRCYRGEATDRHRVITKRRSLSLKRRSRSGCRQSPSTCGRGDLLPEKHSNSCGRQAAARTRPSISVEGHSLGSSRRDASPKKPSVTPKKRDLSRGGRSRSLEGRSVSLITGSGNPKTQSADSRSRSVSAKKGQSSCERRALSLQRHNGSRGRCSSDRGGSGSRQEGSRNVSPRRRRSPVSHRRSKSLRKRSRSPKPQRHSSSAEVEQRSSRIAKRSLTAEKDLGSTILARGVGFSENSFLRQRSCSRRRSGSTARCAYALDRHSSVGRSRSPSGGRLYSDSFAERRGASPKRESRSPVDTLQGMPQAVDKSGPEEPETGTICKEVTSGRREAGEGEAADGPVRRGSLNFQGRRNSSGEACEAANAPADAVRPTSRSVSKEAVNDVAVGSSLAPAAVSGGVSETSGDMRGECTKGGGVCGAPDGRRVSKWKSRWGVAAPGAGHASAENSAAASTAGPTAAPAATVREASEGATNSSFPFKKTGAVGSPLATFEAPSSDSMRAAEKYLGSLEAKPKIKIVLSRSAQQQQQQQTRAASAASQGDLDGVSAAALAEAYLLAAGESQEAAAVSAKQEQGCQPLDDQVSAEGGFPSAPGRPEGVPEAAAEKPQEQTSGDAAAAIGNLQEGETVTRGEGDTAPGASEAAAGGEIVKGEPVEQEAGSSSVWRRPQPQPITDMARNASPATSSRSSSRASPAIPLVSAFDVHKLQAEIAVTGADSGDEASQGSGPSGQGGNMFRRRRLGRNGAPAQRKQVTDEDQQQMKEDGRRRRRSRSRISNRSSGSLARGSRGNRNSKERYQARGEYRESPPTPSRRYGDRGVRDRQSDRYWGGAGYYHCGTPHRSRGVDWRRAEGGWREADWGYNELWDRDTWGRPGNHAYWRDRRGYGRSRRSASGAPRRSAKYEAGYPGEGRDGRIHHRSRSLSSDRGECYRRRRSRGGTPAQRGSSAGYRDSRSVEREKGSSPVRLGRNNPTTHTHEGNPRDSVARKHASPSPKKRRVERHSAALEGRCSSPLGWMRHSPPRTSASRADRHFESRENGLLGRQQQRRAAKSVSRSLSGSPRARGASSDARKRSVSLEGNRQLSLLSHRRAASPRNASGSPRRDWRKDKNAYPEEEMARRSLELDRGPEECGFERRGRSARRSVSGSPSLKSDWLRNPLAGQAPKRLPFRNHRASPRGDREGIQKEASRPRSQGSRDRVPTSVSRRPYASRDQGFSSQKDMASPPAATRSRSSSRSRGRSLAKEATRKENSSIGERRPHRRRSPSRLSSQTCDPKHEVALRTGARERVGRERSISTSHDGSLRRSSGRPRSRSRQLRRSEDERNASNYKGYRFANREESRGHRGACREQPRGPSSRSPSWGQRSWERDRVK